jgi:hypothetical protein
MAQDGIELELAASTWVGAASLIVALFSVVVGGRRGPESGDVPDPASGEPVEPG